MNSPIRVGVDGRVLDDRYHGIGRLTYELVAGLADLGDIDITLFLSSTQRSDRFNIDQLTSHPSITMKYFEYPMTSMTQFLRWPRAIRDANLDVTLFTYHLGAAFLGRGRRVAMVHDCVMEEDIRFAPDRKTRALYMLLTRAVVRRVDIVTGSRASVVALKSFYPKLTTPPQVIEWGVGEAFRHPGRVPAIIGGVEIPAKYFLHVGARRPHKNVTHLIRVLAASAPQDHLILVGSADNRWPDETAALARELGVSDRVIELSAISDDELTGLYAGARAFLFPSLVEGFGLPLLEAMAAGTPVIASDVPVFREIAADCALLADPHSVTAWTTAIRSLDDETTRAALTQRGRARAGAATWQRTVTQLDEVLRAR
jgi:glycosyltransferase involved in cell wall biosynthesis